MPDYVVYHERKLLVNLFVTRTDLYSGSYFKA